MKLHITVPQAIWVPLRRHLFQANKLEQGAFLYAHETRDRDKLRLDVVDLYLIPPNGWEVQLEFHLEMKDDERAKIMKAARDGNYAVIDCHSHPDSGYEVGFSASDRRGTSEFAAYANWKLSGRPYAALVLGENSVDAVAWYDEFKEGKKVDELVIDDVKPTIMKPQGTWFRRPQINGKGWKYVHK